jgi:hypothetical protein
VPVQVLRKVVRDPVAPGRGLFELGYAAKSKRHYERKCAALRR